MCFFIFLPENRFISYVLVSPTIAISHLVRRSCRRSKLRQWLYFFDSMSGTAAAVQRRGCRVLLLLVVVGGQCVKKLLQQPLSSSLFSLLLLVLSGLKTHKILLKKNRETLLLPCPARVDRITPLLRNPGCLMVTDARCGVARASGICVVVFSNNTHVAT